MAVIGALERHSSVTASLPTKPLLSDLPSCSSSMPCMNTSAHSVHVHCGLGAWGARTSTVTFTVLHATAREHVYRVYTLPQHSHKSAAIRTGIFIQQHLPLGVCAHTLDTDIRVYVHAHAPTYMHARTHAHLHSCTHGHTRYLRTRTRTRT